MIDENGTIKKLKQQQYEVFIIKGIAFGCSLVKFNAFKRMRETEVLPCNLFSCLGALKWLTSLFYFSCEYKYVELI